MKSFTSRSQSPRFPHQTELSSDSAASPSLTNCVNWIDRSHNQIRLDRPENGDRVLGNVGQTDGDHVPGVQLENVLQADGERRAVVAQLRECVRAAGDAANLKPENTVEISCDSCVCDARTGRQLPAYRKYRNKLNRNEIQKRVQPFLPLVLFPFDTSVAGQQQKTAAPLPLPPRCPLRGARDSAADRWKQS